MQPISPQTLQILVVDDEESFRTLLKLSLEKVGYRVEMACSGQDALARLQESSYSLILLDVLMPGMDGLTTCAEIRKTSDVPIVMLTALSRSDDIMSGFKAGADDYITKPFTFREVEVRLQAILRRISWNQGRPKFQVIALREIMLNDETQTATVQGVVVHLTPIEYQLLHELMTNADRPINKSELFKRVWGYAASGGTNLVEVAIRRLREKIEPDPSEPTYLLTVRGAGYKFSTDPSGISG